MKGIEGGLLNLSINLREKRILFKSLFLKQKVEVNLESFQAACCLYLSNFTLAVVHSSSALVHSHTKKTGFPGSATGSGAAAVLAWVRHCSRAVRHPHDVWHGQETAKSNRRLNRTQVYKRAMHGVVFCCYLIISTIEQRETTQQYK